MPPLIGTGGAPLIGDGGAPVSDSNCLGCCTSPITDCTGNSLGSGLFSEMDIVIDFIEANVDSDCSADAVTCTDFNDTYLVTLTWFTTFYAGSLSLGDICSDWEENIDISNAQVSCVSGDYVVTVQARVNTFHPISMIWYRAIVNYQKNLGTGLNYGQVYALDLLSFTGAPAINDGMGGNYEQHCQFNPPSTLDIVLYA